ncbi:lipopolysaccharide assembly protein LapA domain-containing protein [Stakelama saccharophila]|uniref:Lipopolysaccharide assembly protein LapA domain-containing protein n=1 Tax=Stakelama saccharophila TaxID=3075605 RepID=A0ABZ0BCZ3_9SPHN|nr:lipopolysaccharide assembly protein LapA domain-containing protein [Stakelama sp. W311]WNO54970.1 lipopolysaccharide assembly protein LapA domain-containing protein [Stakelama sp. W311]
MQFLKTLFWALIIGLAAAFALNNWVPVEIRLWGGVVADVNLPLLLLVTFLIGFVPMLLAYYTVRWRLRQRLAASERALTELRALHESKPATAEPGDPAPAADATPADDGPLFSSGTGGRSA